MSAVIATARLGLTGDDIIHLIHVDEGYFVSYHRRTDGRFTRDPTWLDAETDREAIVAMILEIGLAYDADVRIITLDDEVIDHATPAGILIRRYATREQLDALTEDGRLPAAP